MKRRADSRSITVASRLTGLAPGGRAGAVCRQASLNNGLVMRATGDTMIIAPPLICTTAELDMLVERAKAALDETARELGAG